MMENLYKEAMSFLQENDLEKCYKLLSEIVQDVDTSLSRDVSPNSCRMSSDDQLVSHNSREDREDNSNDFRNNHDSLNTDQSCDQTQPIKLTSHELADVYNTCGHIQYLWVNFNEAIVDYTHAISHDPEFSIAYYNRGQVHYRMGRYKDAERDLQTALKLKPDFKDAQDNLQQVQEDIRAGHKFNI